MTYIMEQIRTGGEERPGSLSATTVQPSEGNGIFDEVCKYHNIKIMLLNSSKNIASISNAQLYIYYIKINF